MSNFERHAATERTNHQQQGDHQHGWANASTDGYKPGVLLNRLMHNDQMAHTMQQFGHVELHDAGRPVASSNAQGLFGSWHQERQMAAPAQQQVPSGRNFAHTGGFGSWHNGGMPTPNEVNVSFAHTVQRTLGTDLGHVLYSNRQR